ncbi:MAG TPA: hypothetical protein VGH55_01130, partial [Chthoniobacterales bacterium]
NLCGALLDGIVASPFQKAHLPTLNVVRGNRCEFDRVDLGKPCITLAALVIVTVGRALNALDVGNDQPESDGVSIDRLLRACGCPEFRQEFSDRIVRLGSALGSFVFGKRLFPAVGL